MLLRCCPPQDCQHINISSAYDHGPWPARYWIKTDFCAFRRRSDLKHLLAVRTVIEPILYLPDCNPSPTQSTFWECRISRFRSFLLFSFTHSFSLLLPYPARGTQSHRAYWPAHQFMYRYCRLHPEQKYSGSVGCAIWPSIQWCNKRL